MHRIRKPRKPWRVRLGMRTWGSLHRLAAGWPCRRCRPNMRVWMEGFHDAVNVRLGKPAFRAVSFGRFATGELEERQHAACLICFFVRTALRTIGGIPREDAGTPRLRRSQVPAADALGNGLEKGGPASDNSTPDDRRRPG